MGVTLAALLGSLFWAETRTKQYQGTARILVTPVPSGDPTLGTLQVLKDTTDPTVAITTAAALVDSAPAATITAHKLGHGWSTNRVLSAVSVQPQGGSNILDVTATDPNPERSARLANTFAQASLAVRSTALQHEINRAIASLTKQLLSLPPGSSAAGVSAKIASLQSQRNLPDPTLSLAQLSPPSGSLAGTSPKVVIPLVVFIGLLLGCVAAVLFEIASGSIRDAEDLSSALQLPVLARLRISSRGGVGKSRTARDAIPPGAAEEVRMLLLALDGAGFEPPVVMVTSASHGEGKTSVSTMLAVAAAAAGKEVTLLELDLAHPTVGTTLPLRRRRNRRAADLTSEKLRLPDLIHPVAGMPELRVLAADGIARGERTGADEIAVRERVARRLPEIVALARQTSEFVVVDAPALDQPADTLRLLPVVDQVLLVVHAGHTRREAVLAAAKVLAGAGHPARGTVMVEKRFSWRRRRRGQARRAAPTRKREQLSRRNGQAKLELTSSDR